MLKGIDVKLNYDFFDHREELEKITKKIIFTGQIDKYFNYKYGELEYRSLKFESETLEIQNYQGNAVVNFTEFEVPYTRIIEHKHFEFDMETEKTIITKEYPDKWNKDKEPYYTINDERNNSLYNKYVELAQNDKKVIFGGRLGQYKYYDMDKVILEALNLVESELDKKA